jgi:transcriptional regulator with XRE-family HTH domain
MDTRGLVRKSGISGQDQDADMATKQRQVDFGSARARAVLTDMAGEIRNARLSHGLSQQDVATAAKTSRSKVSRIELGQEPGAALLDIARLLAVVGLELSARAYPAGRPIRDAAHVALLARFRSRLAPSVAMKLEVPIPIPGDQRAWDMVLLIGTAQVAVEAETRPRDVQALLRRIALKRRDDPGITSVILLLSDTRHNRALIRDHRDVLGAAFPATSADLFGALGEGRDVGNGGVALV